MKRTNRDQGLLTQVFDSRTSTYWQHAFAIDGSITPHILPNVCIMGLVALAICCLSALLANSTGIALGLPVAPYEFIGAALGLLLVLRTNSGYERWWEARKLWGGIVNQARNIAISGLTYGPRDPAWQDEFIAWVAAFPYACCASLRNSDNLSKFEELLGRKPSAELHNAEHMPAHVAQKLALLLRQAYERGDMDRFAFMQIDRERALLIDHIGACERIMNTPLALAYTIKIRRFIIIFLLTLPFALIHIVGHNWLVPALTMLVAYPLFSLDQLGCELQNPFSVDNLSHLPLDEISAAIEQNVLALHKPRPISIHKELNLGTETISSTVSR